MRINYHEHAFQNSPLLKNDSLDDIGKSISEFKDLKQSGFDGYIEATPLFLGRNLMGLKELKNMTGLKIFPVTGFHHSGHYSENLQNTIMKKGINFWTNVFLKEISEGMAINESSYIKETYVERSEITAKVIKIGFKQDLNKFEEFTLKTISNFFTNYDAPMMVHLDPDTDVLNVAVKLIEIGINPHKVVLAHIDRKVRFSIYEKITSLGFFLGFDSFIRVGTDEFEQILQAIKNFSSNILIGGDLARASRYKSYGGKPGIGYVGNEVVPKILEYTDSKILKLILEENPQRWLNS